MPLTTSTTVESSPAVQPDDIATPRTWNEFYLLGASRVFIWFSIAVFLGAVVAGGLELRRWVWDNTEELRFVPDTTRHCYWALESTGPEGFLNQYEKMAIQTRDWDVFLDYVPLRLLVMRQWGVYLRHRFPEIANQQPMEAWQPSYEFTAPLLYFNACMDALGAVCAFFLTRCWVRRSRQKNPRLLDASVPHFSRLGQGWFGAAGLSKAYRPAGALFWKHLVGFIPCGLPIH